MGQKKARIPAAFQIAKKSIKIVNVLLDYHQIVINAEKLNFNWDAKNSLHHQFFYFWRFLTSRFENNLFSNELSDDDKNPVDKASELIFQFFYFVEISVSRKN